MTSADRTLLPALLLALALLLLPASGYAQLREPQTRADAAILVDGATGEVLYEDRPDARRAIASTTKLMTALLVLEQAEPDAVLRAADYDAAPVESQIGLRRGERLGVADLFLALML